MEPQDVNFAIHALGHGDNGFIDGAAGQAQFALKTAEKLKRHREYSMSDKGYYVN